MSGQRDKERTAGRTLDALNRSVKALFVHSGGRDCIVPGYATVGGWDALRDASRYARPHDLWLFDAYPHSCAGVSKVAFPTELESLDAGGYQPLWSQALLEKTDAISATLYMAMVRKHLLGNGNDSAAPLPLPALVAEHSATPRTPSCVSGVHSWPSRRAGREAS